MKKILFPSFNRVHLSRQKLLLDELSRNFQICITTYSEKELKMSEVAVDIAGKFQKALDTIKPDIALLRGDRFEMLIPATLCAYSGIPIAHIEGFDLSGVIDQKVRYAISYLSDYHFVTNEGSYNRAKSLGFENVWNFGSLDVEFALKCSQTLKTAPKCEKPYIVVLYHEIPGEDAGNVKNGVGRFLKDEQNMKIVGIRGNSDYRASVGEEYSPEDFINLLEHASVVVGNSSAGIKEAPALGCGVVNIGSRQANRLKPENVIDCRCDELDIYQAIKYQMGRSFMRSTLYYQPLTSKRICDKIKEILND